LEKLSYAMVRDFLLSLSNQILQSKDELNRMDAECGDGDFGTSMFVAFTNLQRATQSSQGEDIGKLFTDAGRAIIATAGGTAGPIFGTLFIEAGRAGIGRSALGLSDLSGMFEAALVKIQERGRAHVGDKTLIDALDPAVSTLKKSLANNTPLTIALHDAANAARSGYEGTRNLVSRQGKARYLAEQTVGHLDPGAYVTMLLFDTLYSVIK